MATGVTYDTFSESAYITVAEYKNAPTAIDLNNLIVGNTNPAAQDAELARVIMRASSYMNEYLNQNLVATEYVETQRTRFTPQGWISLHPYNSPVIALSQFQYGTDPLNLYTLPDCSNTWFENQQIIIPVNNMQWSSQGPLAFGYSGTPYSQVFTKYTYTAGFVNTLATGTQAATSLTVADATGILPDQRLTIWDGEKTETVTVASSYTLGSTTVPLVSALAFGHTAAACGNLPTVIKEAAIIMTTEFLKFRGDQSLTMMATTRPSGQQRGADMYGNQIALALDMVNKYRRVR